MRKAKDTKATTTFFRKLILVVLMLVGFPGAGSVGAEKNESWDLARQRGMIYSECGRNAKKLINGWINLQRDPDTYLYRRNRNWDYHNEAADHYSSLVFVANFIDPSLNQPGGSLHQTLVNSIKLCTTENGLPGTYNLKTKTLSKPHCGQLAEWLRDGLIRITEVMGTDNDWYREMERLVDAILVEADKQGGLARLFGGSEDPGNMMQTFARLYAMSGKEKYILAAEELADEYLLGDVFDKIDRINFVDHGCELVPGLGEIFALEYKLNRPKAKLYHDSMRKLLDRILKVARDSETGLWYRWAKLDGTKSGKRPAPDCWGYVLFAYENYDRATGENRYRTAIEKPMRWLIKNQPDFISLRKTSWPACFCTDDFSDSYESMMVLSQSYPQVDGVFDWLEWMQLLSGIRVYDGDSPFGSGYGGHFDGSTGRTLCLHMMLSSQGVRAIPFKSGLECGAVQEEGRLYLTVSSAKEWSGKLAFDRPRNEHKTATVDWARINSVPQWFTVRPEQSYEISKNGAAFVKISGRELIEGLAVHLDPRQVIRICISNVH